MMSYSIITIGRWGNIDVVFFILETTSIIGGGGGAIGELGRHKAESRVASRLNADFLSVFSVLISVRLNAA